MPIRPTKKISKILAEKQQSSEEKREEKRVVPMVVIIEVINVGDVGFR
jgi:hypothetical protein